MEIVCSVAGIGVEDVVMLLASRCHPLSFYNQLTYRRIYHIHFPLSQSLFLHNPVDGRCTKLLMIDFILAKVDSLNGVKDTNLYILTKLQFCNDWIIKEIDERLPESQAKTNEIGRSGDNTDTSASQSEKQNKSEQQSSTFESENHTDQQLLSPSSQQHFEWRECSLPSDDVLNMVSQPQSKDRDKFWFCVKLDRPATIVDIRLGRLNGGDISHD